MSSRKGRYWPWLLVALMGVVIVPNAILFWLATSDPSFAVEERYYEKAVDWDRQREQVRRNAALGWRLDFDVALERTAPGAATVTASLVDGAGRPIDGAAVHLAAFHNARAADILRGDLRSLGGAGAYRGSFPLRRPGLWEFRFEVERGADRFTAVVQREVVPR